MSSTSPRNANLGKSICLLLPPPQHVTIGRGFFNLPAQPGIGFDAPCAFAPTIRRELGGRKAAISMAPAVRFRDAGDEPGAIRSSVAQDEGYGLSVTSDGITVWASTEAGHLYGAMTIRQLLVQFGRRIPCLRVADHPVMSRRGIQLCFPQGHTEYRGVYVKHLVKELARQKVNELYLYLESYFDFPSLPGMAGPGAMTPEDAIALDKLCLKYNVRLVPMLNVLGHAGELLHLQKYQHLAEHRRDEDVRVSNTVTLCANDPEVNVIVDGMIDDLLTCFSSDTIHIGGDEVSILGQCPRCRKKHPQGKPFDLYLRYYTRILNRLQANGRTGGLWGDMFLEHCEKMSPTAQKRVLGPLQSKCIVYDWFYFGSSRPSLELFTGAGIRTVACSSSHACFSSAVWPYQSVHQKLLFQDAINAGAEGGMTTSWGNFAGVHEELFDYLHSTGAALLWSGVVQHTFCK